MAFEYFASGTNEPGQLWGFARIGQPVGVAADECLGRTGCEETLLELAELFPNQRVFIDSGAYSEVEYDKTTDRLEKVRPISDAEWRRRLAFMQRIADAYGPRALIIAPDRVGSQDETLERLERYRGQVLDLVDAGAEVAIVLQGGDMDLVDFEQAMIDVLGVDRFVRGFPMKKGATTATSLRGYIQRRHPDRIHLLGAGPKARGNKKLDLPTAKQMIQMFAEYAPGVNVSWDSCLVCSALARDKPGGRTLTRAQDIQMLDVIGEAFRGDLRDPFREITYDWTEVEPYEYLGPLWGAQAVLDARAAVEAKSTKTTRDRLDEVENKYLERAYQTAERAGLSGDDARRFVRDPNAFIHEHRDDGVERWEWDPLLMHELEQEFGAWVIETSAQLRKERSVIGAWAPDKQPYDPSEEQLLFPPQVDKATHRVRRDLPPRRLMAAEEHDTSLLRHPRPERARVQVAEKPEAGEQLTLLNRRRKELKRKLMR